VTRLDFSLIWVKIKIGTGINPSAPRAPFSLSRRVRGSFYEVQFSFIREVVFYFKVRSKIKKTGLI
jgi:hypothetical protein